MAIKAALRDNWLFSQYYECMTDDEFASVCAWFCDEESLAWNKEKKRRAKVREQERQRREALEYERNRKRKDALAFSDGLAQEICGRLGSGELLTVICLDDHMPTTRRCTQWLKQYAEFKALFDQSLNDRLTICEEELVEIADRSAKDIEIVETKSVTRRVLDPAKVTAAKLRIEVRRLHLKAGRPQKWGETSTLITKSEDGLDPANMSAEELEKCIADLERRIRSSAPRSRPTLSNCSSGQKARICFDRAG